MMLNEKRYQSFTHGLLNLISLVLEAADRAALPQEFSVALALWCRNNISFKIHERELIDRWRQWSTYGNLDSLDLENIVKTLSYKELRTLAALQATTLSRRLLMTEQGYIGMAPTEARKGDRICLLLGFRVPVLLRKLEEGGYELVEDVYAHGIMNERL